jgi:tRNA threonylcarbamoyladenosine biosynthesis protein TsaB
MLTLAVDTTADWGSIAVADENGTKEEIELSAPRGFSHVLFGAMGELLKRHSLTAEDVQLFAGASGPGSFTGVRVGLAAIKGLAETLARPAVAVSNLEALAAFGRNPRRAVVIDAHRGEVFAALYDSAGGGIPESVVVLQAFAELTGSRAFDWISQDDHILALAPAGAEPIKAPRTIAGTIARIAIQKFLRGSGGDPAVIEANYVRRSDAELLWKGA